MAEVTINFVAVLIATIANMVIGMLWYGPLFGKQWLELMRIDPKKQMEKMKSKIPLSMLGAFIAALVMSYILSYSVDYAEAKSAIDGAVHSFWVWLGFIATVTLGSVLWEGKPVKLYLLNAAYHLVTLVVMGVILVVLV